MEKQNRYKNTYYYITIDTDTHTHTHIAYKREKECAQWAHLVPFSSFKKCLRELLSRHLTLNAWMLLLLQYEQNVYIVQNWMNWTESSTIMWFSFESHHEYTWAIIVHASVLLFDSIQLYLAHVVHFSHLVRAKGREGEKE